MSPPTAMAARPRRTTTRPVLFLSLLALAIVNPVAVAQDAAAESSATAAAGRAEEVEVGADGSSSESCNCSDAVSRADSLLETCRDDLSRRLSSDAESDLRSEISAAEANGEERARAAARDAEKRANDAAELKASELRTALEAAEGKLAEKEKTESALRSEISAAEKDGEERARAAALDAEKRAADAAELKVSGLRTALKAAEGTLAEQEKAVEACRVEGSAALGVKAQLEEVRTNLAAVSEQKTRVEAERAQIVAKMEEDLRITEDKVTDVVAEVEKQKEASSKLRLDLAQSESDKNDALQEVKTLKESIKRMETDHEEKASELKDGLKETKKDVERHKRLLKASNDKVYDSKRDLQAHEKELRDMHRKATSQYFNTSLVIEDTLSAADKALTHTENFASRVWSDITDFAGPHLSTAWKGVNTMCGKASDVVAPHAQTVKKHYDNSVHPHILAARKPIVAAYEEHAKPHVVPLWKEHGTPAMDKLSEIRTAMYLSFVSAVRQSSRTVATYLLTTEEGKSKREKSSRKGRIVKTLQRADKNAEDVVEQVGRWLGISLMLLFFGGYMFSVIVFFLKLPFYPIVYLRGKGKTSKGGNVPKGPQHMNGTTGGKKKHKQHKKKAGGVKVENNWQAQ